MNTKSHVNTFLLGLTRGSKCFSSVILHATLHLELFSHTVHWFKSHPVNWCECEIKQNWRADREITEKKKKSKSIRENNRCLPEVTQCYGSRPCLSWALVHLVHLISPSTTLQIWERMSYADPNKTLPSLLSDSKSISTLSPSQPGE